MFCLLFLFVLKQRSIRSAYCLYLFSNKDQYVLVPFRYFFRAIIFGFVLKKKDEQRVYVPICFGSESRTPICRVHKSVATADCSECFKTYTK